MGAGDVKFFAAASAWLGPMLAWQAALFGAAAGGLLAIGFLLRSSRLGGALHRIALLPFLRHLDVTKVGEMSPVEARRQLPYGVALAIGVVLAAWFPGLLG
jgi:Flp pilus assembly protein protease CpaA